MHPGNLSLRELHIMAYARMRHNWDMASVIWATICNAHRDPKRCPKPFSPVDIHPFMTSADLPKQDNFELLKLLVTDNGKRRKSR